MASSFREFADKFAVRTSVELDAERRPVLDADDGEAIASTFAAVDLVAGEEEEAGIAGANGAAAASAGARLGAGALYVTTRRVVWVPDAASASAGAPCVSLAYRQIVMHAVATDAAAFARPCLYLQLDDEGDGEGGGGEEGGGGDEEQEGEERARAPAPELRLVPADPSQVEPLFQALCDNSALNPDTDAEEQAENPLIFDRLEALAGAELARQQEDEEEAGAAAGGGGGANGAGAAAEQQQDEEMP